VRFGSPEYLALLVLLPGMALAGWYARARRAAALRGFAGGHVARFTGQVSANRRALKLLLIYVAWTALALAAARPQWGTRLEPIVRRGADVVLVLDTSLSMAAEDVAPNRLDLARHSLGTLLERIPGDRVALVTFAGEANLACPLTIDHAALRMLLESAGVTSTPVPGTALADALRVALHAFRARPGEPDDRGRAIVVFSDGEDHSGETEPVLEELSRAGIAVHAVGCGTARGAPLPLRESSGLVAGYKKDREGRVVTSRLNEDVLERLALATGGRYFLAAPGEFEIGEIARSLAVLSQGELGAELRTRYEERFRIPLLLGLAALIAEALVGDRRRDAARSRAPGARAA
jgi:Ca-activated chloride channel family protein